MNECYEYDKIKQFTCPIRKFNFLIYMQIFGLLNYIGKIIQMIYTIQMVQMVQIQIQQINNCIKSNLIQIFPLHTPALNQMTQISQDVFYQVKKQILDKLDIILQKVNLEVIDYIKPNEKEFRFIELSQFEKEIHVLFQYLDRLYASLNSSVSFSSNDINSYATNLKEDNYRIAQENQKLKTLLKKDFQDREKEKKPSFSIDSSQWKNNICRQCLAIYEKMKKQSSEFSSKMHHSSHLYNNPSDKNLHSISQSRASIGIDTVKKILKFYNHSIKLLSKQFQEFQKSIKKTLKDQKFRIIQNRVEYIARNKEYLQNIERAKHSNDDLRHNQIESSYCQNKNCKLEKKDEQILEALNQILQIC